MSVQPSTPITTAIIYLLGITIHLYLISYLWLLGGLLAYTTDLNIRGKKLYVSINSSSLKQELSMGREKIKKIINEELGEEYIEDVIIR